MCLCYLLNYGLYTVDAWEVFDLIESGVVSGMEKLISQILSRMCRNREVYLQVFIIAHSIFDLLNKPLPDYRHIFLPFLPETLWIIS